MKRYFQRFVEWLYADRVADAIGTAVTRELRRRMPELRDDEDLAPSVNQDVYGMVILHLPSPAEVIHANWGDANELHLRTLTVAVEGLKLQLEITASRTKVLSNCDARICFGDWVYLLDVKVTGDEECWLWFQLKKRRIANVGVEGEIPYWRQHGTYTPLIHRFTAEVLKGVARGLQNLDVL